MPLAWIYSKAMIIQARKNSNYMYWFGLPRIGGSNINGISNLRLLIDPSANIDYLYLGRSI